MRLTVLTISIFSLLFSCFTGISLSHAGEYSVEHHSHEHVIVQTSEVSDSKQIETHNHQCDDCCSHSHSVALLIPQVNLSMLTLRQTIPWYSDGLYATHILRLKRPPKA